MARVLCLGNLQLDVLCRPITAFPPPGALAATDSIDLMLSGNGGNVAAVLGRLGVPVDLAGYRGADTVGEALEHTLASLGVGTSRLLRHPNAGTGVSVIAVTPEGERSVLYVNEANAAFDLDEVPDDWLSGYNVVSVGSLFVLPLFSGEAVGRLLARAQAQGAATMVNIGWPPDHGQQEWLRPALAHATYFILSYLEGRQLTGRSLPHEIFDAVEALSGARVVLTLGGDGCCYREGDQLVHIPAAEVKATDTTGAGDAFVAGFSAGLVQQRPLAACTRLACRAASYAVTGPGAYPRIPPLSVLVD